MPVTCRILWVLLVLLLAQREAPAQSIVMTSPTNQPNIRLGEGLLLEAQLPGIIADLENLPSEIVVVDNGSPVPYVPDHSKLDVMRLEQNLFMIPAFALGRTQEILALLALLMQSGQLRRQPVYIGGLGMVFTEIYDLEAHRTHRNHREPGSGVWVMDCLFRVHSSWAQ